jgi:hypothetical protein
MYKQAAGEEQGALLGSLQALQAFRPARFPAG